MRTGLLLSVLATAAQGCTAVELERHTVNQALSVTDLRYREILNALALVAYNPGALPAFSVIASGTANVTNTAQVESITLWDIMAFKGFSKQTVALMGRYQPEQQWQLNPVVSQPQLKGLWYACLWMIQGPPPPGSEAWDLLRAPSYGEIEGYHLAVLDKLAQVPPNWLCIGKAKDVPRNACYTAHHGHTFVWVTPEGIAGLSAFTLVVMDIATIDPQSLQLPVPMASLQLTIDPSPSSKKPGADDTEIPVPRKVEAAGAPDVPPKPFTLTLPVQVRQTIVQGPDGLAQPGDIMVAEPLLRPTPLVRFDKIPPAAPKPRPRYAPVVPHQVNMSTLQSLINSSSR